MLFNKTGNIENEEVQVTTEAASEILEVSLLENASPEDIHAFLENHSEIKDAMNLGVVTEKTIIRLDKKAKLSKAYRMAVFQIAKEKKDPKFKKLLTIWRIERALEAYLLKRYGNEGMRRAKKSMSTAGKSKSALVKKVASKVHNQLNGNKVK